MTGDTVNVASRLQSAGRPGAVTVGERTVRATQQAIRYDELEPLTLKGKAEPVPAWEAVGLVAAQAVRPRARRRSRRWWAATTSWPCSSRCSTRVGRERSPTWSR